MYFFTARNLWWRMKAFHKSHLTPTSRIAFLLLAAFAALILLTPPPPQKPPASLYDETTSNLETGHVHDLIRRQALSHAAFHSPKCNDALVELALSGKQRSKAKIVVVGVEFGKEVRHFVSNKGWFVYAFEALPHFKNMLQTWIEKKGIQDKIKIFGIALGEKKETIQLRYQQRKEQVLVDRLEKYVTEYVDVVSIDVQGMELNVLKGGRKLLEEEKVGTLWLEMIFANDMTAKNLELLKLLDRHGYTIFDFAAWGRPKGIKGNGFPKKEQRDHFVLDRTSKRDFKDYLNFMTNRKEKSYVFLQTDLVAIRKDLMTPKVLEQVSTLAHRVCEGPKLTEGACRMRAVLAEQGEKFTI